MKIAGHWLKQNFGIVQSCSGDNATSSINNCQHVVTVHDAAKIVLTVSAVRASLQNPQCALETACMAVIGSWCRAVVAVEGAVASAL